MRSVAITAAGDIDVSNNGPHYVDGLDYIAQKITIRLRTFLGEWFLDRRVGMPYFQTILTGKFKQNLIEAIYKEAILTVPGALEFLSFDLSLARATRLLTVTFRLKTVAGVVEFNTPFIIEGLT